MTFKVPPELRDAVREQRLIIFVGAGVSTKEGLPSWKELVIKLLDEKYEYIEKSQAYKDALTNEVMTPLEVLDKIESSRKHIFDVFERELTKTKLSSAFVSGLSKLTSRFITTNFDTLIEDSISGLRRITKDSQYNLTKIDTESSYVLKMHGDIKEVDRCVIFTNQYADLYSGEHLAAFQLQKLFTQFTVLFIGFSFSDEYVRKLFSYIAGIMKGLGPTHYIVSRESVSHDWLSDIIVDDYSELDELVDALADDAVSVGQECSLIETTGAAEEMVINIDGSDIPPQITSWVGREKEIEVLKKPFKVFFITGLGGQGKSALAAHYLEATSDGGEHEVNDWRDFKEESHKFENKIISMIMLVSTCRFNPDKYVGLSNAELVQIFFDELGSRRAVFVLDNVDSYIDLEGFEPLGGVGVLFRQAVDRNHKAKFIFTCRPFVRYASVDFFQLALGGLGAGDVEQYFKDSELPIGVGKVAEYAREAYELTKGHPLWISLIVAQAKRGERELREFLSSISRSEIADNDQSSIMSENILGKIWMSLSDNHKLILRSLAESVQALTLDDFSEIVSGEMTYNRFVRTFKSIRNLSLVVEKAGGEYVELHPLVKEFIRKRFASDERAKYIYMFIKYYDKLVLVLKPKLSGRLSFNDFLNWTNKIELYSNAREFQKALDAMYEIHDAIKSAGYMEEYLRVTAIVVHDMKWTRRNIQGMNNFERVVMSTTKSAIEYGDRDLVEYLLEKYESVIEDKEPAYINICDIRAYQAWFQQDYAKAIDICEKAKFLLRSAKQPDNQSLESDYALALRDSGDEENMHKALEIFLEGEELSNVVNPSFYREGLSGVFYGNIGRCLQSLGKINEAIVCLRKSFMLIYDGDSSDRLLNLGYAGKWMYEVMKCKGELDVASYFYRFSLDMWERSSPPLFNRLARSESFDQSNVSVRSILGTEAWRVESYCNDWVRIAS